MLSRRLFLGASLVFLLCPSSTVAFKDDSLETPIHQIPFLLHTAELPYIRRVSSAQWESLNSSVSGRLHRTAPFARECFKTFNGNDDDEIDQVKCDTIQHSYRNEILRTSHPAAQINPQWETCQAHAQGCLLDYKDPSNAEATKRTCEIGSLSTHYIEVHGSEDVKAAFSFSRSTSVPLVIKNTGHDYKGRSTAPHSLQLWTHKLQDMEYHEKFTPSCPAAGTSTPIKYVPAVTLGAGVQWYQAYAFAEKHNVTLVGGADRTVGAVGGWLQGGGHGALSNTMGLGADRVLEFKIVTPDGELRIANDCQNKDLFFALRGGGGGTFGVVISATILASPPVRIQATLIQFPMGLPPPPEFVRKRSTDTVLLAENIIDAEGVSLGLTSSLWSVLLDNSLRWAHEGWGGYVNGNSALYINPVLDDEEAIRSMRPLVEWATQLRDSVPAEIQNNVTIVQGEYGTWGHFFSLFADGNSADLGEPLAIASRLVPTSSVSSPAERDVLLQALLSAERIAPGVRFLITTPFSYAPADAIEEQDQDQFTFPSVHPAWRDSIYHITTVSTWNWNTTQSEVANKYKTVSKAISELAKVSNAAYHNEADVYESNWQDTFWGDNYALLLSIKNKYDPEHLLDCWHCVGWNSESSRFSCYL